MSITALIVAAGRGLRAGGDLPKQYRALNGRPVLAWTLEPFLAHDKVDQVVAVIHPADAKHYEATVGCLPPTLRTKLAVPVHGGDTRQDSVRRGLEALVDAAPAIVLVHDGARPFVSDRLIAAAIAHAGATGAAVPGCPVTDTVKTVDASGVVTGTLDRESLRAVQTPQGFDFALVLSVHRQAADNAELSFTDDAALFEWARSPVQVFAGDPYNVKLTRPEDFEMAEGRFRPGRPNLIARTGSGFDVHAFGPGNHVWLGGIRIPHERGVEAHSDGDVILHALTDALLGALADGDIGVHFPPSDPQWRGASSDRFLTYAVEKVRTRKGFIDHLDVTLLCERPRLGPYREAMRARIAEIAGLQLSRVSIKATTTEKLGFTGRGEGIAAQAIATIRLPEEPA
jgi:2-C-methyl-D-erythritol 4-phosphate cytidylyltransferase/2-C-methyl-D-erythritol 2,4-cyclodiphosphate synthase